MCTVGNADARVRVHTWSTEYNLSESVLSFHHRHWATEMRASGLQGKCFSQLNTGHGVILKYRSVTVLYVTVQ